jgi:hypothetical protein
MERDNIIVLTIEFEGLPSGKQAAEPETGSPRVSLLRPFRRIAQLGKPTGTINYVFFQGNSSYYTAGSLAYSPESCLLFFPGLTIRSIKRFKGKHEVLHKEASLEAIDHLTLEPGYKRGHITTSTGKKIKHKTKLTGPDTVFWFAMSTRSPKLLEPIYSKVKFSFACPPSDSKRRVEDIMKAKEAAVFHLISLAGNDKVGDDEFLHLEFFVVPDGESSAKDFPMVRPLLATASDNEMQQLRIRLHPVGLQGLNDKVWIRVSKPRGKLADDVIITFAEGSY